MFWNNIKVTWVPNNKHPDLPNRRSNILLFHLPLPFPFPPKHLSLSLSQKQRNVSSNKKNRVSNIYLLTSLPPHLHQETIKISTKNSSFSEYETFIFQHKPQIQNPFHTGNKFNPYNTALFIPIRFNEAQIFQNLQNNHLQSQHTHRKFTKKNKLFST